MRKVALIVADAPHFKTEKIALKLLTEHDVELIIVTVPFISRPARNPIFQHRPDQSNSVPLHELAAGLAISLVKTREINDFNPSQVDYCLITGGVLIPSGFIKRANGRVFNCHPGLIPECRGLDAFKWAILENKPVGNTLHLIDDQFDLGFVLCRRPTPIFSSDSLESFALRHYEAEIDLLASFMKFADAEQQNSTEIAPVGQSHRRMSRTDEQQLSSAFKRYKQYHALDRN